MFIFHVLICLFQQLKGKKPPVASNGVTGKGKTLSSQPKKADPAAGVKRTASNAAQYKYGKNRVEADAKRLQTKEEELLKRKEVLRNRLAQLRKERKDLRAAIEVNAGMKDAGDCPGCMFVLETGDFILLCPKDLLLTKAAILLSKSRLFIW